jgi:hypothetical protein
VYNNDAKCRKTRRSSKYNGPVYVIQVDKTYYSQNGTVKVYIKVCGNTEIGGFLIEAREEGKAIPLGNFSEIPETTKHLDCTSMNAETAVRKACI